MSKHNNKTVAKPLNVQSTKQPDPIPVVDTKLDDMLEQVEFLLIQAILHQMRPDEIKMKFDHIRKELITNE